MEFKPAVYPRSKILYLPAIKERVPVFEGTFRISQDVRVSSGWSSAARLGKDGKTFAITGKLEYQACDKTKCFCRHPFRSNGNCKCFPWIGPEPRRTFDTSKQTT